MADRLAIEAVLNGLYAARVAGQLEPLCGYFAPAALFKVAGSSDGKPIAIEARGEHAIHSWLAIMLKTFRLTDHEILTMLIDGKKAAVHWRARIHSKVTGVSVLTELVDLFEIADGFVVSYSEIFVPVS
jgi:ketosteroid isomerase-like protein